MTVVEFVRAAIERRVTEGVTLLDAARQVRARFPEECLETMDRIGLYPSSERELSALQRIWP
jgi:hypothetical protein